MERIEVGEVLYITEKRLDVGVVNYSIFKSQSGYGLNIKNRRKPSDCMVIDDISDDFGAVVKAEKLLSTNSVFPVNAVEILGEFIF